jgi:hypothetical protein
MHNLTENMKGVALAAEDGLSDVATLLNDYVDAAGWDRAVFILNVGALVNAKTLDMKITECDTSGGVYADIEGAALAQIVGDVSGAKNALYAIEVSLTGRKRYLAPVITAGALAVAAVSCTCILHRGSSPADATAAGLGERVLV